MSQFKVRQYIIFSAIAAIASALPDGAAAATSPVPDADSTGSVISRTLAESRRQLRLNTAAFSNPAMMPLRQDYSLGSIRAGWESRRESQPFTVETGHGGYAGSFDASAYYHNGSATLWGDAAYSNGRRLGQRWNESADFDRLYPYVTADSIGGNLNCERYSFAGGYAHTAQRVIWGVCGGYTAVLSYRNVDPRPRDITGDLTIAIGAGYRAAFGYTAALALYFDKFRQSSDIAFMSELGVSKIYHLTGLGSHYYRFAGTGTSTYNDCHSYGLSLNLISERESGAFLNADISLTDQTHVIEDLNRLPMASLWHKELNLSAGWRQSAGRHRMEAEAGARIYRRHGTENIFGDATSGTYPQIGSLEILADNHHSEYLRLLYELHLDRTMIGISPYATLSHRRTVYLTPRRDRLIDTASVGTELYADRRFSDRLAAMLTLSASHRIPRTSLLELPAPGDAAEADLHEAVTTGFLNASCGATSFSAEAKADYALSRRYALGVRARIGYTRLSTSPHALEWSAAAVFSF